MKRRKKIQIQDKVLLVPFVALLFWLAVWIYGYILPSGINKLNHLALGVLLSTITMWIYFSEQLKGVMMIRGLNLFLLAACIMIFEEAKIPLISDYTSFELANLVAVVAFMFMTFGFKQMVFNNKLLLETMTDTANTDFLTGLPNRRAISKRIGELIEDANREGVQLAIFLLDIDNFKNINDTYGHEFGDQVLVNTAQQMDKLFSNDFFWGRQGGDEFLVVQKNVKSEEDIENTAKKIIRHFDKVQAVDDYTVYMPASVGISIYPKDGTSTIDLVRKADRALYKVKRTFKNSYAFYASNLEGYNKHNDLKVAIINALRNNEFEVHYQPIIDLSGKNKKSYEALVRWYKSDEVIIPAAFIPVAEMYGLISDIDFYVLRRVCENYKRFRYHGCDNVSVNLSAQTIINSDLTKEIRKLIEEFDVAPTFLTFEITETAIIRNENKTFTNINSLNKLGFKVNLDDFGTGYSSLNHLRTFPVNAIKIDKKFIDGIGHNHKDELVITAIVNLATNLGIEIIAEGVECKEQVDFLHTNGCHKIQGYYFGKPMKLEEILISNMINQQKLVALNSIS
jgi:diguanylate cyclase (GGDEF)-like protein